MPRVRAIVALLLAVLLFGGGSVSYACGLACQDSQASLCAPATMTHMAMMDCDHCPGHVSGVAPAAAVSMACGSMPCGNAVVLPARADDAAPVVLANPHWIVTPLMVPAPLSVIADRDARRDPPREISAFHPLLVSLRV